MAHVEIIREKSSDMRPQDVYFAGYQDNKKNAFFYCGFSAITDSWPASLKIDGVTYQFEQQMPLDNSNYAGHAQYTQLN